jgi:hypothetical protein
LLLLLFLLPVVSVRPIWSVHTVLCQQALQLIRLCCFLLCCFLFCCLIALGAIINILIVLYNIQEVF